MKQISLRNLLSCKRYRSEKDHQLLKFEHIETLFSLRIFQLGLNPNTILLTQPNFDIFSHYFPNISSNPN